ncbi:MAG: hypothetical protein WED06_01515 [Candidatus Paceibacterota bacterium]
MDEEKENMPEVKVKEVEEEVEKEVEEVAKDLQINLPLGNLPLPIKLIVLFTLIGGLSIVGSAFADIFDSASVSLSFYILRLVAGLLFILIAYGLYRKQRWAIWLNALMVVIGFLINPILSLFPAVIVAYLYFKKDLFRASFVDHSIKRLWDKMGKKS